MLQCLKAAGLLEEFCVRCNRLLRAEARVSLLKTPVLSVGRGGSQALHGYPRAVALQALCYAGPQFCEGRYIPTNDLATTPTEGFAGDLAALHEMYKQGKLRLLVGAGASKMADFPSWDALDRGILQSFLRKDLERTNPDALQQLLPLLPEITASVYDKLGRDSIDMVWDKLVQAAQGRRAFFKILAKALYDGRRIAELPVPALHRQIAAMERATLYTTNYEPLIELAMARVRDGIQSGPAVSDDSWQRYVGELGNAGQEHDKVYHIHGFVDPDGVEHDNFVLTEDQYRELAKNPDLDPNKALLRALKGGALLILGMSLNDPNLRRLLYEARNNSVTAHKTYAILKQPEQLVADYQEGHWRPRGIQLIFVSSYDLIESVLRQVKYGAYQVGVAPSWCNASISFLRGKGLPEKAFKEDEWQLAADQSLKALRTQLVLRFPVPYGEEVGLELSIPRFHEGEIQLSLVARPEDEPLTGAEAETRANLHSFRVRFSQEEGAAAAAFVTGQPNNCIDDSPWAYQNIGIEKKQGWVAAGESSRWRSILSIPIADSENYIPVAVVSITSNYAVPFWTQFGQRQQLYYSQLKSVIRSAAAHLLFETKVGTKKASIGDTGTGATTSQRGKAHGS